MATKTTPTAAKSKGKPERKKQVRKKRIAYPGLIAADGAPAKLKEFPADYDPKVHKPLRRVDFECESVHMLMRADELDRKSAKLRMDAAILQKGGKKVSGKAKKLQSLVARMAALRAELEADDFDVDAMLATLAPKDEESGDEEGDE